MSTETLAQALTANVVARFGAGKNFLILSSSGPVDIVAVQLGSSNTRIVLEGALEGFTYKGGADGDFDMLEVSSATDQPGFVIVVGDDDVSYPSTVQVSGTVQTVEVPSSTVSDTPEVVVGAGPAALFAANAARKRITVFSDPGNTKNTAIYFRKAGGANNIGFVTPGQSVEFKGTFALDYDAAVAGDSLLIFEEL